MTSSERSATVLSGETVTLRPLAPSDAGCTFRWRNGARAGYMQEGAQTEDEQRTWIQAHSNKPGEANFILELRGTPVGMIALQDINLRNRSAVLGRLLIGEPAVVGQLPVFFETELLICDYAFDVLGLHKLYGEIMENNVGMIRTRLYLGYKQDGVLRDHYLSKGTFRNAVAVSLLEREYRSVCRPKLQDMILLFRGIS